MEINGTEPYPSVRIPCLKTAEVPRRIDHVIKRIVGKKSLNIKLFFRHYDNTYNDFTYNDLSKNDNTNNIKYG
jgi:hypothetical protein